MELLEFVLTVLIAMECFIILMRDMRRSARPRRHSAVEGADGLLAAEQIELQITHWSLARLRAFCALNNIPSVGCETREQYMDAIEEWCITAPAEELKDPETPKETGYTDPDAYLMRECAHPPLHPPEG